MENDNQDTHRVLGGSSDTTSMTPDLNKNNTEEWPICMYPNKTMNMTCFNEMLSFELNWNSPEINILKQPAFAMIVIICYVVVIFLGAVGNCMVVLTVIKTKQMWNATNLFIANLALADIFVCIFDLPFSVYSQITGVWIFGATLCKLIPMLFGMVVYSSTLTLTMIAIDRYILVVHPLKTRMSISLAMGLIVIIAIVSAAVASPIAIYSEYDVFAQPDINLYVPWCRETWEPELHRKVYTILTLVLQYFIPLLIIAVLYTLIFRSIRKRMSVSRANSRKTKTTKMLVAVVTVFTVTWTPFHIHSILSEFGMNFFGTYYKFADALLRVFAMSSSCINPFLYGWMNDNYKNAFLSIIRKPTMAPKGIHREESDHTIVKSNHVQHTPSPIKALRKPLLQNKTSNTDSPKTNGNGEILQLEHIRQNGVGNGSMYHSSVHVDSDTGSTEVILEK